MKITNLLLTTLLFAVTTLAAAQTQQPKSLTKKKSIAPFAMKMNEAVMVTVELDFGSKPPSIADALKEIERVYKPKDGKGRTFAILDAYGERTAAGMLHISMHVSSEKEGEGKLIFKRTGEILWHGKIKGLKKGSAQQFSGKNLTILFDDGKGKTFTVDGSMNPSSIITAHLKEPGLPVSSLWKDGAEHEITFIYSACGCPVKVMAKRVGDRTMRTKELPVIFPDDPSVITVIDRVMKWK